MTVNVTCTACDGAPPCGVCAAAAHSISAAGFTVHHSSRYAALRAAAAGTYGFDACVVPIGASERAVTDAVGIVLAAKRVALVLDEDATRPIGIPDHFAVLDRRAYEKGALPTAWLTDRGPERSKDDTTTRPIDTALDGVADFDLRATRRVTTLVHMQRERLAAVGDEAVPLDMMSVLEDEVAWARASELGFGLVLVHLGGLTEQAGARNADAAIRSAVAALRSAARRGDSIGCTHDDLIVVLPEADPAGAAIVARRAAHVLAAGAQGLPARPRRTKGLAAWSAGVAACPADGSSGEALIARATADLRPLDQWMKDG